VDVLEAFTQIHAKAVVHTDVKPKNVLICERDGQSGGSGKGGRGRLPPIVDFKLIDYGLAFDHEKVVRNAFFLNFN
jgi:serine/threonine protein kinase